MVTTKIIIQKLSRKKIAEKQNKNKPTGKVTNLLLSRFTRVKSGTDSEESEGSVKIPTQSRISISSFVKKTNRPLGSVLRVFLERFNLRNAIWNEEG